MFITGVMLTIYFPVNSFAQESDSSETEKWNFNLEANFYFSEPFIFTPVVQADKKKLHLEARYNYEDEKTFSGWAGYNFSGGKKFEYKIIPMAGFLAGNLNGAAAGVELTFNFTGFELNSNPEYVFDFNDGESNFYYNWTDFSYSPADWLFFGLSYENTVVYNSSSDIQAGFLAGGSYKDWELTAYLYNLSIDDPFVLITVSVEM